MTSKILKYTVFVTPLVLLGSCSNADPKHLCEKLAGQEFYKHLSKAELQFGEEERLLKESIQIIDECLATNQACFVSTNRRRTEKLNLWSAKDRNSPITGKLDNRDRVLVGAVQFSGAKEDRGCVAISRLLVNASPWFPKGWRQKGNTVATNDKLLYFADFPMYASPGLLLESINKSYQKMINKKTKAKMSASGR